jgi:hypothetical protein
MTAGEGGHEGVKSSLIRLEYDCEFVRHISSKP